MYTYKNSNGVQTVDLCEVTFPDWLSMGFTWYVTILHTGEMIPVPDEFTGKLIAESLNAHAFDHFVPGPATCEEDQTTPRVKDGVFMNGLWAGLPAAQEDGVWGAWLFERFSPWQ